MKIEYVIQEKGAVANEKLQQLPNWVKSLREEKRAEKGSQKLQKENDKKRMMKILKKIDYLSWRRGKPTPFLGLRKPPAKLDDGYDPEDVSDIILKCLDALEA